MAMEGFEVRAFGCLVEDLLAHTHADADAHPDTCSGADGGNRGALEALRALKAACMVPDGAARPRFSDVAARLAAIEL